MNSKRKVRALQGDEGFTFVELMIVILIIGLLVGIAVLSFVYSVSLSKKTACNANLKTIREQITLYNSRFEANPPTLQDLVPGYIDNVDSLYCPDSGEAYIYDEETGDVFCPFHEGI